MKYYGMHFFLVLLLTAAVFSQEKTESASNLKQFYSGKFGFYSPTKELNNGLLFGVSGITEFTKSNFFLSADLDLYLKKTFDMFDEPKPDIKSQQLLLLPLHANFGYKLFEVADADTRGYVGAGIGYYFYFYSIDYNTSGGFPPLTTSKSEIQNSGGEFGSLFARVLLGKIFVESRVYLAASSKEKISNYTYNLDPSGFSFTIGIQQ